ncbi:hypothetical protein [Deinococcus fonticola]|uniref:hypothetical protein n=1 Tax=Deinococcus fonticola TaxID=2528713 RepID=UPI001074D5D5|nr:hypothetical protein [Deinococcus fonticola]
MIVKCSFGRVPLTPWDWEVLEAAGNDVMEFVATFGQALFDASEKGGEPDFSAVPSELIARLARFATSTPIPDRPNFPDTLRLADALWELNAMDTLGKFLSRYQKMVVAANTRTVSFGI